MEDIVFLKGLVIIDNPNEFFAVPKNSGEKVNLNWFDRKRYGMNCPQGLTGSASISQVLSFVESTAKAINNKQPIDSNEALKYLKAARSRLLFGAFVAIEAARHKECRVETRVIAIRSNMYIAAVLGELDKLIDLVENASQQTPDK